MPLILIVDADAGARARTASALIDAGHYCMEAANAGDAVGWAQTMSIDLIIADAGAQATGAVALRNRINDVVDPSYQIPFIFLVNQQEAAATGLSDMAQVGTISILPKPPDLAALRRAVEVLLGAIHRAEGTFEPIDEFDQLLARIEADGENGVLTAYRGRVVKKVFFESGALGFVSSNDPRELADRAFVRAGLVTDEQLRDARSARNPEALGRLLRGIQSRAPEKLTQIFTRVTKESVLDLYLWGRGKWFYFGGGAGEFERVQSPVRCEIGPIRTEGRRRAKEWPRILETIGATEVRFEVHHDLFPEGFPSKPGDKRLLEFAEAGYPLGRIKLELGGQDYAILSKLASLMDKDLLTAVPIASNATRLDPYSLSKESTGRAIQSMLEEAADAIEGRDPQAARALYEDVLAIDPTNADARSGLLRADVETTQAAHKLGLLPHRIVELASGLDALKEEPSPTEAFVLSRLAGGAMPIADLVEICPLLEHEVMHILQSFLDKGTVRLT